MVAGTIGPGLIALNVSLLTQGVGRLELLDPDLGVGMITVAEGMMLVAVVRAVGAVNLAPDGVG